MSKITDYIIDEVMEFCLRCENIFHDTTHVNYRYCPKCRKEIAKETYRRNRNKIISDNKSYYIKNIEKKKKYDKDRRKANHEVFKEQESIRYENYRKSGNAWFISGLRFCAARSRARKKNLDFNLTRDWIFEKLKLPFCEATGLPFNMTDKPPAGKRFHPFAPSIDRIDPKLGYTTDNCRMVIWIFNQSKSNTEPSLFDLITSLYHIKNNAAVK